MDSGNSGSIQSSSGGDEEYDSRSESISAFLMNPTGHIGPMSNPPPHLNHHGSTTPMFDPLSNYFDPMSRPPPPLSNHPNSLLNLDMVWSKPLRSEPNSTEINPILSSVQPFFGSHPRGPLTNSSSPTVPFPPVPENPTLRSDQPHVARNPKKRSRASRRAPTTVLTTDTTNFRAMVQEFTGIPAPPFTSSPFPRGRLDLFGTPSTMRSNPSQPAPYLLRPFTQKVQPPLMLDGGGGGGGGGTTNNNFTSSGSASNNNASTYGLLKQPQSEQLNMQNPVFTFQSPPPKYPTSQASLEIPSNDHSHLKPVVFEEFGSTHGLSNLISSDGTASRNNPTTWGGDGVASNDATDHLRSVNGNYNLLRNLTSGKLNYSASSSNFHGDKGSENLPTRGEGMVESWICSSD
uniref:Putative VQ motif-containing protein n=1 Tax=Davidia involucrata TaxID=16924 RepID=A0A5B7AG78_DAVIN